jgi:hypothetical protein
MLLSTVVKTGHSLSLTTGCTLSSCGSLFFRLEFQNSFMQIEWWRWGSPATVPDAFGTDDSYQRTEDDMLRLLLLFFGGALGTLARYGLNGLVSEHQSKHYPWAVVFPLGTLVVNAAVSPSV